ncbi:MAG TPA: protein-L-isoaspartate(D-aspartate) O-methyltransferase [Terriglobales bacterium]
MTTNTQADAFRAQRRKMMDDQLLRRGIRDERVLDAMAEVPRHEFVARDLWSEAYEDHPLPIGDDQTLSQPYIVAAMLEALKLTPSATVLEVGTGSGYQTAILAEIAKRVFSIERLPGLADPAAKRLSHLGYENVTIVVGDGSLGLPEYAPYDGIVVSAASPAVPPALLGQLKENGRMIIPVGPSQAQRLYLIQKHNGEIIAEWLEGCRFVPLIGAQGYKLG